MVFWFSLDSWYPEIREYFGLLNATLPFFQNTETLGMVLEDFDTAFANKFYHSHLDDSCQLNQNLDTFLDTSVFIIIKQSFPDLFLFLPP